MLTLNLGPTTHLRSLQLDDAPAVHALMTASRQHLDRWLRWSSAIQTLGDVEALFERFQAKEAAGNGFHLGIWDDDELAGGAVCWGIHRENRNAEVGYWIGGDFTGRGLATRSTKAVIGHLFAEERLHRIEMQCGVENAASRSVAERCGLVNEGVRRESHWITDRYVDHVVYGILDREWSARPPE